MIEWIHRSNLSAKGCNLLWRFLSSIFVPLKLKMQTYTGLGAQFCHHPKPTVIWENKLSILLLF